MGISKMIYSFECEDCGEKFDVNITLAEFEEYKEGLRKPECPACGSEDTTNYISGKCSFTRFWNKL